MGKVYIDQTEENRKILHGKGMVIGAVEILPPTGKTTVSTREVSRAMVVDFKSRQYSAAKTDSAAKLSATLATSALCTVCANNPRFCGSVMCKKCIGQKAAAARGNPLGYEITGRDFLMMCLLTGLLLFFIVKLGAPASGGISSGTTVNSTK